jgi:L-seryl-tRNA(Ser) seleniumtransferase
MNKKKNDSTNADLLRSIPAVDLLLKHDELQPAIDEHGISIVTGTLKEAVGSLREQLRSKGKGDTSAESIVKECKRKLELALQPKLRHAVNATGIILHTGLGRSPIPQEGLDRLSDCTMFCNLQTDLESGKRSQREANLVETVKALTGAEDAIVVNNCAGATMLVLKALASGREVVVSRGELIEIGGSFRLPDIMKESGAVLNEVGSTNKTHPKDYESAVNDNTAVLFKAHKSNYSIVGFSQEVTIDVIAGIGKKHGITVVDDLGCGALIDTQKYGLPHEVTVRESLEAGSDVALFSTDKLIGGPQGGMIVGKKDLIAKIRKDPLYRILRICKLTLSALEGTLQLFTQPELLETRHPLYAALARQPDPIGAQAKKLAAAVSKAQPEWSVEVVETTSILGGGSLPGSELPSHGVSIASDSLSAESLASSFRNAPTPVFGRIEKEAFILDMRTVTEQDEKLLIETAQRI